MDVRQRFRFSELIVIRVGAGGQQGCRNLPTGPFLCDNTKVIRMRYERPVGTIPFMICTM